MSILGQVMALLDRFIGRLPMESPSSTDLIPFMKSSGKRHGKATIADIVALGSGYQPGGTDVAVADGGTGRSSHTAYAVLCGGTSTTAAQQSIASVGTSGQVLTSNGAGALPTFQAPAGWYSLQAIPNNSLNPADDSTYYLGLPINSTTGFVITADKVRIYIPKAGTIKTAQVVLFTTGTTGSNENISCYVRLNNTTDTLIQTVGAATAYRVFINASLSIAVVAGDYIEFKFVFPTWATNPTGVRGQAAIVIQTA